jgi:hypothetical protein
MKNKDRTIKLATFDRLDAKISRAIFELEYAAHTVSIYHGRNARITKAWRSTISQIRNLRTSNKLAFKEKISN